MKRCPQCEFIYEDDQSLCDMDGVLLVFDSRTLPNVHALATVSAPIPEKGPRRSRMVPAFATLLLMLAIGSVYYVSTTRNAAQNHLPQTNVSGNAADAPGVVPTAGDPNQAQVPVAEPTAASVSERKEEEERETQPSPAVTKPAVTAAPTRKATTTKPVETKPGPKKNDSKVESILKKTGKILKKPFKF